MYKHAFAFKRPDQLPDEASDKAFRRSERAEAGIEPLASACFIFRTKLHFLMRGVRRGDYVELADRLNWDRKFNAQGHPWTHRSVRRFVNAFLPQLN